MPPLDTCSQFLLRTGLVQALGLIDFLNANRLTYFAMFLIKKIELWPDNKPAWSGRAAEESPPQRGTQQVQVEGRVN